MLQSTQRTLATGAFLIVRSTGNATDELERTGEGGGEFVGVEAEEAMSPPSPSLSIAESSTNRLFFLG